MALKKSQLYSSLWQSCDELRGGMDASQYKDYVLTLLFMKYVSDKHGGRPDALIEVPQGGGFADIAKLKGDKEIGDKINKIIGRSVKTIPVWNRSSSGRSARGSTGMWKGRRRATLLRTWSRSIWRRCAMRSWR